ncbi:transglutaminase-like cysteine peptidase [Aurantimonas sp. A2-1-M11]|uniref:transglutaminase-like cysteine peptidase n=1 Tax=Aurantimonas sp. A2-1-M11 TaxID=3113712 RepID=UPI002F93AC45
METGALSARGFAYPSQAMPSGPAMTTSGRAFAPPAFYSFCANEPVLCGTQGEKKLVDLTPQLHAQLERVNKSVNRRIRERADPGNTGADKWELPATEGDCEDFAILKKAELMKRGWPASVLLLTVATMGNEGHTVLTVRTSNGDLVLDNRVNRVKDWSSTPYRYFARQSQTDGSQWQRV